MAGINEPLLWSKEFKDLYTDSLERIKALNPDYTALLPSDPGITILDAYLYQIAILGKQLNLLPYASLVSWVNYLGVEKKGPTAAKGTVRVVLEEPLNEDFLIPTGTRFLTEEGIPFISTSEVIIPAGEIQGDVPVECEKRGTVGNVPQNHIIYLYQRLPYIKEVYNPQPTTGGFDSEPDNETLDRGRKIIRHLWRAVTVDDYEEIARSIPGVYKAKAIDTQGEVRLYVLSQDSSPANSELLNEVLRFIREKQVQGISVSAFPAVLKPVAITANVRLKSGYTLETVRKLAEAHLKTVINPKEWLWGRKVSISEILAALEEVQGIDYVEELILPAENIRLEPYELATLSEVTLYAV